MIELQSPRGDLRFDLAIAIHGSTADEDLSWPTAKRFARPWRPFAFGMLLRVFDGASFIGVDQDQIGIITNLDASFANDAPNPRGCVACPTGNLFPSAFASGRSV